MHRFTDNYKRARAIRLVTASNRTRLSKGWLPRTATALMRHHTIKGSRTGQAHGQSKNDSKSREKKRVRS